MSNALAFESSITMSGFEVAGLVLAIFPIVVRGLQQFTDGVQIIKSWKRYQRELSRYSRTLETQEIVYLNTIERLFEGIIQTNEELEELIEDPAKAFSQKPQYEESLRNRLGRSYDNYLLIMKDLLEVLIKVRKELGLDEQGKVSCDLRRSHPVPKSTRIENLAKIALSSSAPLGQFAITRTTSQKTETGPIQEYIYRPFCSNRQSQQAAEPLHPGDEDPRISQKQEAVAVSICGLQNH